MAQARDEAVELRHQSPVAHPNHLCNHAYMPPRSTVTMTLRIDPRLHERIASWARRDGQSLNAMTLEMLECALDSWDEVEARETEASTK